MADRERRYNVTGEGRGNSNVYGLQRLERERPDLLERVRSGALSTHAAMVEAGYRKRTVTISTDPRRAAATLCQAFPPASLRVIARALQRELLPEPDRATEQGFNRPGQTYYVVVDGEDVSKHRKMSNAFRQLDKQLQDRRPGEPGVQAWVRDQNGGCFH